MVATPSVVGASNLPVNVVGCVAGTSTFAVFTLNFTTPLSPTSAVVCVPLVKSRPFESFTVFALVSSLFDLYFRSITFAASSPLNLIFTSSPVASVVTTLLPSAAFTLNLIPLGVLSAFFVVSPVLPPKKTLLSNFLLTISSCSSVAARPDLAKFSPPNVVLVKPVMSPVLPSNLIGWFPVVLPSVIFTTPSLVNSTLPLPVVLVIEVMSVKSPLTLTA